jgi:peptidoglycan hydrolase CwlO-like protein
MANFYKKLPKNLTEITNSTLTINGPVTVTNEVEVKNDVGNPIPISAASLPLPAGASTAALQTAGNSILTDIETELQAANVSLVSIDSHVDGLEASLVSIDSKLTIKPIKNYYNEILSISSGSVNTILSKTVSLGSRLKTVQVSGTNIAEYEVLLNGSVIDKQRSNFGTSLNCSFTFENGITLVPADVLLVRVRHDRPSTGNFNAKFIIEE